jgi:DegV family protein with EDD domain
MAVRIVTDSVADIPVELVRELGIRVVPFRVRIRGREWRDGIDLSPDEFYAMLREPGSSPLTSAPPPAAFAEAFDAAAAEAEEVLMLTLSSKLSGGYDAARQGLQLMSRRPRIEVIDSGWAAMPQGFMVMEAARAAQRGASLAEALQAAREAAKRVGLLATFDTLEYLRRGGRIGAAKALLGSLLKVNPLIGLADGAVQPVGRTRSRAQAVDRLYEFAASYRKIDELGVESTACEPDADALVDRLAALHPRERILRSRMTPAIGSHTGPGLLVVAVLGDRRV